MNHVFRLIVREFITAKTWAAMFVLQLLGLIFAPNLAPVSDIPGIVQPARAQAVWYIAWALGIVWLPAAAAAATNKHTRNGLRLFFGSQGISHTRYFAALSTAYLCFAGGVFALTVSFVAAFAYRSGPWFEWAVLNGQAASLAWLATSCGILIAITVSSHFASALGVICGSGFSAFGMFGVFGLERLRSGWFWQVAPHLDVADQMQRIIFNFGPLPFGKFLVVFGYLAAWVSLSWVLGLSLFKRRL